MLGPLLDILTLYFCTSFTQPYRTPPQSHLPALVIEVKVEV